MAEPEVVIADDGKGDEDMEEADQDTGYEVGADVVQPSGLEAIEPTTPEHVAFADYLRSPVVELVLGRGVEATILFAHQTLVTQSPFFAGECAQFDDTTTTRRIELPEEDADATASVLEYLYKSDYFPALSSQSSLEYDPTVPRPDDDGVALLRHARIYTLAQRLGLPQLAALAHKKIHLTQSTAKGEIAYARFVYKETNPSDDSIRRPVAAFWASRSHVLRHEAEHEFKRMVLEFPQFGYDVLSMVLDQQEKRSQRSEGPSVSVSGGRKRQRTSTVDVGR